MITNIPDRMMIPHHKFYHILGIMLLVPNIVMMIIAVPIGVVLFEFDLFSKIVAISDLTVSIMFVYGVISFIMSFIILIGLILGKTKVTIVDQEKPHH